MTSTLHIVVAMKPLDGNFASNAIKHGVAGLNIDACRIGYLSEEDKASATPQGRVTSGTSERIGAKPSVENKDRQEFSRPKQLGRFPANVILEDSDKIVKAFPITTSGKPSGVRNAPHHWNTAEKGTTSPGYGDTGSSARFFKQVKES